MITNADRDQQDAGDKFAWDGRWLSVIHIFPCLHKLKVGGCAGLSLTFRALMEKAGITCSVLEPKGAAGRRVYSLGFHSLRRAFNTDLANCAVSQEIRQRLIGHASEEVNDGYTTIEMGTFKKAIATLPCLEGTSVSFAKSENADGSTADVC